MKLYTLTSWYNVKPNLISYEAFESPKILEQEKNMTTIYSKQMSTKNIYERKGDTIRYVLRTLNGF